MEVLFIAVIIKELLFDKKLKSMFDGTTELEIKQVFFDAINTEVDETVYDIYKKAEIKLGEEYNDSPI